MKYDGDETDLQDDVRAAGSQKLSDRPHIGDVGHQDKKKRQKEETVHHLLAHGGAVNIAGDQTDLPEKKQRRFHAASLTNCKNTCSKPPSAAKSCAEATLKRRPRAMTATRSESLSINGNV
jgi:hypothetical protein